MFTGLVEQVGTLAGREPVEGGLRLTITAPLASELSAGESVAVNGVCLTAVTLGGGCFSAEVGPETARVTTLAELQVGSAINLERALRADGRFGGHFVQGHVDAVSTILALRPEADFLWLTVGLPPALARFVVPKGSIAVDGISLTVAALYGDRFDVQIVPFTLEHTNLRMARPGARVNIECDLLGKYVARAMEAAGRVTTL
jgi:riboflavin synthase